MLLLLLACAARAAAPTDAALTPAPAMDAAEEAAVLPDLDAMMRFDDPAGSEAAYRALLPGLSGEPALLVQTRIARCQGLQRRYDEALATLDAAAAAAAPGMAEVAVRLPLERGRVLNSRGDAPGAVPHFRQAVTAAEAAGLDGLWVDAAHMLGIALPPDEALAWNLRAIAFAEASADPAARRWLGALYNNTGWTLMDRGEPAQALVLFEKGVAWREADGKAAPLLIARYTVARAWRALGRCEEALPLLAELEAAWAARGEADGYVHEELGECLWALGRAEEARPQLARAHALLSQDPWLVEREPARLEALRARAGG